MAQSEHFSLHNIQGNSKQFDKQLHAIAVFLLNLFSLQNASARLQDHIHILSRIRVSLNRKVHESNFKLKQFADVNRISLLGIGNDLVSVLFEKSKNV